LLVPLCSLCWWIARKREKEEEKWIKRKIKLKGNLSWWQGPPSCIYRYMYVYITNLLVS
jgi:hypothetical protein